ncbi:MAG: EH signature domain-containing protein [Phycisphaerales bacterium]|nr:EH signature domain-containing protein [Phycisphaerales bacterium]
MQQIEQIISGELKRMRISSQAIVSPQVEKIINSNIDKLEAIVGRICPGVEAHSDHSISQVFIKFNEYLGDRSIIFDRRELKILTFALSYTEGNMQAILNNEDSVRGALQLFNDSWRDRFLIGLINSLLKDWHVTAPNILNVLQKFIGEKLQGYQGNRKIITSFKKNWQYFDSPNGDVIFGDYIFRTKRSIQNATDILEIPKNWFTHSYFSRVIITYYERHKSNIASEIDNINSALKSHKNEITYKRLISKIIIQATNPEFECIENSITTIALQRIGDPEKNTSRYYLEKATEDERNQLENARVILRNWLAKSFINIFFTQCINDSERLEFWKHIAEQNKNSLSFKVISSQPVKDMLSQDERIREYLDARFITVTNSKSNLAAFVFYINDYMLIEFSDPGYAFYAYKINGQHTPDISIPISNVNDLRNANMPLLIYRQGITVTQRNDEGRLFHRTEGTIEWIKVFQHWFREIAKINV